MGQHEKAIECYEKAIELEPKYTTARVTLAACYRKLDQKTECAEQCEIAF
ncbi:MAG: tetratricopeptide repeat protein, partial [Methanotrichaceae archaeon]